MRLKLAIVVTALRHAVTANARRVVDLRVNEVPEHATLASRRWWLDRSRLRLK